MNILKYLNSNTVRNYLDGVNYKFTPIEMAWIIYNCNHITLKEKFEAWETLVQETDDCEVSIETDKYITTNLHKMIKDYMNLLNKYYDIFTSKEEDCVYYCDFKHENDCEWNENRYFAFRTISDCWDYISRECSEADSYDMVGLQTVKITKKYLYEDGSGEIEIYFTPNKEVIKISLDQYKLESEEFDLYCSTFLKMCPLFPVPFEKGDIVIENANSLIKQNDILRPFVIDYIPPKDEQFLINYKNIFSFEYDETLTYGFTPDCNGHICEDHEACYMDLEYYNGDFDNGRWILKAMSECMKGCINPAQLLMLHQKYLSEYIK